MAESKIVHKDNHLIFEDGRFYVTETPYEGGRQTDFPKKIDVTDDVKKAIMPKTFIDIDKFICGLVCKLSARKKAGRGPEGLRTSDLYQLLTELLAEHDVIYKDGSLIKIGESKKCEGTLGKMLKEKRGIEIPFGAKDSELQEASYYIPEGFHAEIEDNKVVIKKGEKTTVWSEEDEAMINNLYRVIDEQIVISGDTRRMFCSWLKSLKDRYTWKPSNEQMNTLEYYMHTLVCNEHKEILFGLYADLKKLIEE